MTNPLYNEKYIYIGRPAAVLIDLDGEKAGYIHVIKYTDAPMRYQSPVGTFEERTKPDIWPGEWIDANGYCRWYYTGSHWAWHTGTDLNLNEPQFDADAHAPIYSIGAGEVYAVRKFPGWDWVICIQHKDCLSRYAHVENIQVTEGQVVKMGQHLANIGNAGGNYPYHLHFDITKLDARMRSVPGDWPRDNKDRILRDYHDPKQWLQENQR